jgi:hypothetical protein
MTTANTDASARNPPIKIRTQWILARLFITDSVLSAATTNSGHDRNLRSAGHATRESTRISDVLVPDENVDVFSHLTLLRYDAISNARIECPQSRQRLSQSCGRLFDLDYAVSRSKFEQRTGNVKDHRYIHLFVLVACSSTEI